MQTPEGTVVERDPMSSLDEAVSKSAARDRLETVYPPQSASAAQMRQALRAYLSGQALDAKLINDVVLATEEAFINAVGHAEVPDEPIRVTARVSDGEALIEVRDRGCGFTLRTHDRRPAPDVHLAHGRGLFLMERLMDEVSVTSGRRGTIVRLVRHLA